MGILGNFIKSTRTTNILLAIFDSLLLLGVFFLGFNAANWTSVQINETVSQYCKTLNEQTGSSWINGSKTDYWGNIIDVDFSNIPNGSIINEVDLSNISNDKV